MTEYEKSLKEFIEKYFEKHPLVIPSDKEVERIYRSFIERRPYDDIVKEEHSRKK